MTEKEYRSHPAISRSELWNMNDSPEKFKWFRDHPIEPTPALLFGQVVHKLLLQPDDFGSEFAIAPDVKRNTKDSKAEWAAFCESVGDVTIITAQMYQQAREMVEKALSVEYVRTLLSGQHEVPFFWTDPDTGEQCKCRVDVLTKLGDKLTIVDYKSARSAKTDVFNSDIFKLGYHYQAAYYSEGVMKVMGLDYRPDFIFVVQEKKPPYALNYVTVPPEVMLAGMDKYREFLGIYHECNMTGWWYGYTGPLDEPNEAYLPGYMQMGDSEEDEEE